LVFIQLFQTELKKISLYFVLLFLAVFMGEKQAALAQQTISVHLLAVHTTSEVVVVYSAALTVLKGDAWGASIPI